MLKNFEICFVSSITDLRVGSYRIWINDLSKYMQAQGVKVQINGLQDNVDTNLIIILGKADVKRLEFYKRKYPKNIIGIINPKGGIKYNADFIIVGSVEEKDSLSKNRNVIIFPLIEKNYAKVDRKVHFQKEQIVIGLHGSYTHLPKCRPHLKKAIEKLDEITSLKLKVITNPNAPEWKHGRPKIKNLEFKYWNLESFSNDLLDCDIGVVPNITDFEPIFKKTCDKLGLYDTDYFFRMKNKSNAGRMFVFIQHGIPVVADFTPSNMHILADPQNGYAVFSSEGWLNAFIELLDFKRRNNVAKNAYEAFQKIYDPANWTIQLVERLIRIQNNRGSSEKI